MHKWQLCYSMKGDVSCALTKAVLVYLLARPRCPTQAASQAQSVSPVSQGDEWEEKWGEYYHSSGHIAKSADKWGKSGANVWHERWGEQYDGGWG